MAKQTLWGRAWGVLNALNTVYGWITGAFALALVGGYWAFLQQGLHWALFIGSGILFFGSITAVFLREYARAQDADDKLILSDVDMSQRGIATTSTAQYRPSIRLRSLASYPLYFEVKQFECSFGGASSSMDPTERLNGVLPPNDVSSLSFPTIMAPPEAMLQGRLWVVVSYGKERSKLDHVLDTTVRVSCLPVADLSYIGPVETLRNTLRIGQQ